MVSRSTTSSLPALEQYALAKLQVLQAHKLARGDRILVAIIDGGVDTSHPELAGVIVEFFDAVGTGDKIHAHGTAVAGAIAARGRLKGTAPAALILAARAFGAARDKTEGTSFHVVEFDRLGHFAWRARHQHELRRRARSED